MHSSLKDTYVLYIQKHSGTWVWRIDKQKRLHKPSFMMTNADFDDDLVNATACNENEFSKENIIASRMYARAACGVMLIVISFIVNI